MYTPRLVFWETTRRCNLNCIHCRAVPVRERSSDELDFDDAKNLIDQIVSVQGAHSAILVLSGGEPLFRSDIFDIARYAKAQNLRVALATNGTLVTKKIARGIKDSGIERVSISLDGKDEATHDGFRQSLGSFKQAISGFKNLKEADLSLQLNVTVARHNLHQLDDIMNLALTFGADALHIFLLVPVGCGQTIPEAQKLSPQEQEDVLLWLYEKSISSKIHLKATCAPQYFRIMKQRGYRLEAKGYGEKPYSLQPTAYSGFTAQTKGCLAGTGICFISYKGDVYPCGYLPVSAGNIRDASFNEIWNYSELFLKLRKPSFLKGRCGRCEFVDICEGCRARAYAKCGDYLAEEPECLHQPQEKEAKLHKFDFIDRNILNIIQCSFPTTTRPYADIAGKVGISEEDAFSRTVFLRTDGTIRRIGGFFNSQAIGYTGLLVGLEVLPQRLDMIGNHISRYSGVTHNYSRKDGFNLWFTLTCESQGELRDILDEIRELDGVVQMLELPTIRQFKLDVRFYFGEDKQLPDPPKAAAPDHQLPLDGLDKRLINILSHDLPMSLTPFKKLAEELKIEETQLVERIESYRRAGIMRKFACILNHRSSGFNYNAMSVWEVPAERIDDTGKLISSYKQVSHCYHRPALPSWPYNLYAMIHCQNQQLCDALAKEIALKTEIKDYKLLYTEKEFKKTSMEYFENTSQMSADESHR